MKYESNRPAVKKQSTSTDEISAKPFRASGEEAVEEVLKTSSILGKGSMRNSLTKGMLLCHNRNIVYFAL